MKTNEYVAEGMTYGGASMAVFSGLTWNQIGVIVGIVVGVAGLCLQLWYTLRRDRREHEAHLARMKQHEK